MDDANKWRAIDIVLAVLAAVIVAYGVLVLDWSVFVVIALFWLENVIIGVLNVAKMWVTGARSGYTASMIAALALSAFFIVHYGMFTAAHGIFVVGLFGEPELGRAANGFFEPLSRMIGYLLADRDGWLAAVLITVLQGAAFFRWLGTPGNHVATLPALMFAPYGRIVILHVTIIVSGILVLALKAPVAGALLLVTLKLVFDLMPLKVGPSASKLAKFDRMLSPAQDDARRP
ncbi:MAG TPA: DUF6498-containing protein [Burkholderiaceae bacterium]|jgi:hypothetical protein|nr:DUF6498-containing protein [Burkholderiaceae bacterium]